MPQYFMLFDTLFIAGMLILAVFGGCVHFRLTPQKFMTHGVRMVATYVFAYLYRRDRNEADALCKQYQRGLTISREDARDLFSKLPGASSPRIQIVFPHVASGSNIPFVYESLDAPPLQELRERYALREMLQPARDEYEAMLLLGAWIGTRWDHGTDTVPGGSTLLNPAAVIQAGEQGAKFWCEIAAKTLVLAATSLGWIARLTTTSRDGYTWEHAVAELWSNQFRKWFVIDPDFNVVYEADGAPLSAFELCHHGLESAQANRLSTRILAPTKFSLPLMDLLAFYAYTHIEMRTDWHTRRLRRGSPAGGDFQTWWTARPGFPPLLTAKVRVDRPDLFDWPVNTVMISAYHLEKADQPEAVLHLGVIGYSPYFERFQARLGDGEWQTSETGIFRFDLPSGDHALDVRIITLTDECGPTYEGQILDRRRTNRGYTPNRRKTSDS